MNVLDEQFSSQVRRLSTVVGEEKLRIYYSPNKESKKAAEQRLRNKVSRHAAESSDEDSK